MSATPIVAPFPVFNDVDGQPLDAGYIYVGTENLEPVTNPISIYWDEALTIPAVQPVRTINGYPSRAGTPATFFAATNYSILVRDHNGSLVFSAPTSATASALLLADVLRSDLASADPSKGDALIGMKVIATGAIASTVHLYNEARPLYAKLDFGAVGDGVADDYAKLQAAIDAAIVTGRKLIIEQGTYKTSAPLLIAKWSGTAFSYFVATIEGAITPWDFATSTPASGQATVVIKPTFKDTFAIGIQNGRAVSLKNVFVLGQNTFGIGSGLTAPNYPEMMTNTTFVNNGVRDSRYSPYSGICVDPFGTSVPADGGYPGMSGYYVASAAGSSGIEFENVKGENFTVGCMVTPNGVTNNAENITFDKNCAFDFNKVGVAIGQSQSRNVNWYGGSTAFNLYCFDGASYGNRSGSAPNIFGANMSGKYLFNIPNNYNYSEMRGIHAESFASIGFLGGSTSSPNPITFDGGLFNFSNFGGIFADWQCYADGQVEFNGITFNAPGGSYVSPLRMRNGIAHSYSYRNCSFGFNGASVLEFMLAQTVGSIGNNANSSKFYDCILMTDSARGDNTGKSHLSITRSAFAVSYIDGEVMPYGTQIQFADGSHNTGLYFSSTYDNPLSLGSLAVTTGANGSASFTAADGTVINTGDIIYNATNSNYADGLGTTTNASAWNALGIVTGVVGNVVTISGWPQSLVSGTFALYSVCWQRYHEASTCTTNSSTSLTLVSPTGAWRNGQHIRGSGIPTGAYIVSGGGTATLTISKAATSSAAGVRIYDADVYSLTGTAV